MNSSATTREKRIISFRTGTHHSGEIFKKKTKKFLGVNDIFHFTCQRKPNRYGNCNKLTKFVNDI